MSQWCTDMFVIAMKHCIKCNNFFDPQNSKWTMQFTIGAACVNPEIVIYLGTAI